MQVSRSWRVAVDVEITSLGPGVSYGWRRLPVLPAATLAARWPRLTTLDLDDQHRYVYHILHCHHYTFFSKI